MKQKLLFHHPKKDKDIKTNEANQIIFS